MEKTATRSKGLPVHRIAIACALMGFVMVCGAQTRITGKVVDSLNRAAIASATITLHDRSGLVLAYDITDSKGSFSLFFEKTMAGLWLSCNAMGYSNDSLLVKDLTGEWMIALVPLPRLLPPVTVKNRRSFLNIRPDTSSYKTEDFVQKQDRTIEDVLRKIPGIEIDASGKISHNGKPISNFYIDGDDVVNDRYTIATRTVRPEMVEKIQVIENHNPVQVLQNATISNNTAVNLSLRKEARLALMGDAGAGIGNNNTNKATADLLSFKRKFKSIDQFKTNNTGVDIASELTPHTIGDLIKRLEQNAPKPFLGVGGIGNPDVGRDRFLFNQTGLITLNNSFTPKAETQLKLNVHYLYDQQDLSVQSNSVYTLPGASFGYDEYKTQKSRQNSLATQFNITVNKKNYYLNNVLAFNSASPGTFANTRLNGLALAQQYNYQNWDISNDFSMIKKKRNRNIVEWNAYIRYQHLPEKLGVFPGVNDSVFNNGIAYDQLQQRVDIGGWFTHESFSYRIVHDFIVQNYKAGIVAQWQPLKTDLSVINGSAANALSDSFNNNLTWNQYKAYMKAEYDIVGEHTRLSLSVPLSVHYIHKTPMEGVAGGSFTRLVFSPGIRWRYDLNNENYITTSYQYNAAPTSVQENFAGYILANYMLLQSWRIPVVTNSRQLASIGWTGRKSVKLLTVNVNIGVSGGTNGYVPAYTYLKTLQVQTYTEGIVHTSNRFVNAGISKYVFALRTTLSGKFSLQQNAYEQFQQTQLTRFSDLQQSFTITAQSKIVTWFTAAYHCSYTNSVSRNKTQESIPSQKASLLMQQAVFNIFPADNFSIRLSGEHYRTKKSTTPLANTFFTDAQLAYQLKKQKTELSIDGMNLTNNQDYTTLTTAGNRSTQIHFPLRPFMLMFSVRVQF